MSLWAPLEESNFKNPYPMYAALRKEAPVYKAQTGEWIITKYKDVKNILKDNRFISGNKKDWVDKGVDYFKSKEIDFKPIAEAINAFLLFLNPPYHTTTRKLITTAWDDRQVEYVINENIETLLNKEKADFDIIKDFAQPLPAMTIARIMGIPIEDYEMLRSKGNELLRVLDLYITFKEMVTINDAAHFFVDYFRAQVETKKKQPDNALISKIIEEAKRNESSVSDEEIISLCIFLFLAGEETTVSLIGNGLLNLESFPDQKQLLLDEPAMIEQGIEELLRYDSPVHVVGRIATEEVRFGEQVIRKGDVCTLCLASANRDEDYFDNANELMINRSVNRHLAFGYGKHFCLGDWLARKQGRMAISSFLDKFPDYKIDENSLLLNNNLSIRSYLSIKLQHP